MESDREQPIVTVFRSRLRPGADAAGYSELADLIEARARSMPGFVDFKTFTADDGERVSIIVFDSAEHQRAWREDPEHRAAQLRGRRDLYAGYVVSVCRQERRHAFGPTDPGDRSPGVSA